MFKQRKSKMANGASPGWHGRSACCSISNSEFENQPLSLMEPPSRNTLGKGADPWKGLHSGKNPALQGAECTQAKALLAWGGAGGENRGTTLSSVQQMPFREALTESPVLGSRSRGVGMPREAGPGASAWSTSVTERSLLLRVVPGRRHDRHLMGQLGDNAAQGRELTSYHFIRLYQPFRGRRQNQTTMLT